MSTSQAAKATTENRNFEIYFGQAKNVAGDIYNEYQKVKQVRSELDDIAKNLTGSDAITKIRTAVQRLSVDVGSIYNALYVESHTIWDSEALYESAESALTGQPVTESSTSGGTGGSGQQATPQSPDQDNSGQKQQPGSNTGGNKASEKNPSPSRPTMGWIEDFDYVDKNGTVYHYDKAYINADGKVIAYQGKTSWKKSFLGDYSVTNGSVTLKPGIKTGRAVYEQGKGWVEPGEQEGIAKRVLPLLEKQLVDLEGEATLFGAEASGEGKLGSYDASAKFLTVQGQVSVGVGTYLVKNPDGSYSTGTGLSASAAASAAVVALSASGFLGNNSTGTGVAGDAGAKVLSADASGNATAGWVAGKGPQVNATGEVGAKLVEAKGSAGVALAKGLSTKVSGSVSIGVGASASFGYSDGKFHCELGAALGIGFKISFDIDLSGAVNAVCSAAKAVYGAFWDVVERFCGEAFTNQMKSEVEKAAASSEAGKTVSNIIQKAKDVVDAIKNTDPNVLKAAAKAVFSGW